MSATPDSFKRKVYDRLGRVNPLVMPLSLAVLLLGSLAPQFYREITAPKAEEALQEQEYTALEKRVAGIVPMRKYVAKLQEEAGVVLKLPGDALPAGTNPEKLRQQGEKLSAAYEAEVRGAALDIALSSHLPLRDIHKLSTALESAYGHKIPYSLTDNNYTTMFPVGLRDCQAQVKAQPGFVPGEAAIAQMTACTDEKAAPARTALLGSILVLSVVFAGAIATRVTLGRKFRAEDAAETPAAAAPQTPAPAINTATGQDITVKPIKITQKTP